MTSPRSHAWKSQCDFGFVWDKAFNFITLSSFGGQSLLCDVLLIFLYISSPLLSVVCVSQRLGTSSVSNTCPALHWNPPLWDPLPFKLFPGPSTLNLISSSSTSSCLLLLGHPELL
ncbi:unnamed protein product [Rangifer tarandus platyrhynchus]|uniref:Uncharacterized protein n=2 Tax=Rangifer tarandus platyrhynchus TaxID=3082113 RepID=A0AC59Y7A7_RANTA|nr:unnamed protein product [Rangifer tarandus platyrhynchus]